MRIALRVEVELCMDTMWCGLHLLASCLHCTIMGPSLAVSTERGLTLFVLLGNVLTRFCTETGVLGGDSGIKLDKLVGG